MINYRLASTKDDAQLLALANSTDMGGIIALRTERNPSFFDLIELRGKSKVYVAVDSKKIVGSICVSHEDVYIKGEIHALSYISDFKVAKSHRNQGIGLQLTNMVTKYLETKNTDFAFLNVSKGNKRPFVFFSDRENYPDFENIGTFNIFQFIGTKRERKSKKYPIEAIGVTDEILKFLNDYYRQYELANVITRDNLKGSSIFCVRKNSNLIAVMCLLDTSSMKQHLVLKLPWYLKLVTSIVNCACPLTGTTRLPSQNEPIKMLYLKYLAVANHDRDLIQALVYKAKNEVHKKTYSFVSFGLHEKDPLINYLSGLFKITFYSVGMLVSMKNSLDLMYIIKKGIPFKDFSTV